MLCFLSNLKVSHISVHSPRNFCKNMQMKYAGTPRGFKNMLCGGSIESFQALFLTWYNWHINHKIYNLVNEIWGPYMHQEMDEFPRRVTCRKGKRSSPSFFMVWNEQYYCGSRVDNISSWRSSGNYISLSGKLLNGETPFLLHFFSDWYSQHCCRN